MINQLRTLLLNQPANTIALPSYPGEEFVPSDYAPRTLTGGLATVHSLLFGIAPDRAMFNMRLRQLLGIIHSTDLSEFVYALDPRVTYWPPNNESLYSMLSNVPTIVTIVGTSTLYLSGSTSPFTDSDKLYYSYMIEVIDGSNVTIADLTTSRPLTTETYVITAGLSNLLALPGTDIQFQFQTGVGAKWTVTWLAYPAENLPELFSNLRLGLTSDLTDQLFGVAPLEPFLTFKNLWFENPYPPYQLSGVTLARKSVV